jgi:hypothetical protein
MREVHWMSSRHRGRRACNERERKDKRSVYPVPLICGPGFCQDTVSVLWRREQQTNDRLKPTAGQTDTMGTGSLTDVGFQQILASKSISPI